MSKILYYLSPRVRLDSHGISEKNPLMLVGKRKESGLYKEFLISVILNKV